MARKEATGAALVTARSPGAIQMAEPMEMAANPLGAAIEGLDLDVTGTEEMDAGDVRLPTWALNTKATNAETGRAVPPDEFLNTVTETSKPKLRLIVLSIHKSRMFRENDTKTQKAVVRCRSWDEVTGIHETLGERPCKGCPDHEWTTTPEGKRQRNCADVRNVLAIDREDGTVGMIKVKKAAIRGLTDYYQRFFHKKDRRRTATGQTIIRDNPLFAVETIVEPEVQSNAVGTWYVPTWTMGGVLPKEEILDSAAMLKSYLGEKREIMQATVAGEADVVIDIPDAIDTTGGPAAASFDPNEFADDAGSAAAGDGRW